MPCSCFDGPQSMILILASYMCAFNPDRYPDLEPYATQLHVAHIRAIVENVLLNIVCILIYVFYFFVDISHYTLLLSILL